MNIYLILKCNIKMCSISLDNFNYEVGAHITFEKTISKTILNSLNMGMYTFQIFLGSPQSFSRTQLKQEDINKCLEIQKRFPTKIYTHAPYVYNLAGSKDHLAWSGNIEQDEKTEKILKSLENEINQVSIFGQGVVLHPGTYSNKEKGCKTVAKSISKINFIENSNLILENMAGQGNVLGSTFEELSLIKSNIDKEKQKHIKFCIDTAHIHGKGLYNLGITKEIDKLFVDLENILGLENISLFHLNDSNVTLGSKLDRHALLYEGEIWKNNKEVLRYFLDKTKHHNIPCVMETDPSDMIKFYHSF